MPRTYTDYANKIALTVPEQFIDVKTGVSRPISSKVEEQIQYHTNNGTLPHFLFSALHQYLKPRNRIAGNEAILQELSEIKRMLAQGYIPKEVGESAFPTALPVVRQSVDLTEVEDVLDAFGG